LNKILITLPETNSLHQKNGGFEWESPFPGFTKTWVHNQPTFSVKNHLISQNLDCEGAWNPKISHPKSTVFFHTLFFAEDQRSVPKMMFFQGVQGSPWVFW